MAAKGRTVSWDSDPFGGAAPMEQIVRIESGPPKEFMVLSYRLTGVWTHFLDGRTRPCFKENCPGCDNPEDTSRKWQGWLAVCNPPGKTMRFLALTENAVRGCPSLIARSGPQGLRGRGIIVGRRTKSSRGEMVVHFSLATYDAERFPQAPDMEGWLSRLWRLHKSDKDEQLNDYRTLQVSRPAVEFNDPSHRPGGGGAGDDALGKDIFRAVGLNWEGK